MNLYLNGIIKNILDRLNKLESGEGSGVSGGSGGSGEGSGGSGGSGNSSGGSGTSNSWVELELHPCSINTTTYAVSGKNYGKTTATYSNIGLKNKGINEICFQLMENSTYKMYGYRIIPFIEDLNVLQTFVHGESYDASSCTLEISYSKDTDELTIICVGVDNTRCLAGTSKEIVAFKAWVR